MHTESFREISVPPQASRSEADGFSSICHASGVLLHGRVDDRLWAVSTLRVGGEGQRFLKSCTTVDFKRGSLSASASFYTGITCDIIAACLPCGNISRRNIISLRRHKARRLFVLLWEG